MPATDPVKNWVWDIGVGRREGWSISFISSSRKELRAYCEASYVLSPASNTVPPSLLLLELYGTWMLVGPVISFFLISDEVGMNPKNDPSLLFLLYNSGGSSRTDCIGKPIGATSSSHCIVTLPHKIQVTEGDLFCQDLSWMFQRNYLS